MNTDTPLHINKAGCCGDPGCGCKARSGSDPLALTVALLIVAVLGFAAYAKFTGPNPHEKIPGTDVLLDHAVAAVEVLVIVGLLALHRLKAAWLVVAVMFAGFAGYAGFYTILGRSCGCFGNLWKPPLGVTLAIDAVFALAALGLARRRGASARLLIPTAIIGVLACAGGYLYADSKPRQETIAAKYENKDGPQRLLESELLADVRALPAGSPAYYLFVFDPDCHVCEEMMPRVDWEAGEYESTADPVLQVRKFSVNDLESQHGIERWAFAPTPFVVVVRDGQVLRGLPWQGRPSPWFGEGAPYPKDVKALLEAQP